MARQIRSEWRPDRPQGHENPEENKILETQDTLFKYLSVYLDKNQIGDVGARHLSEADFPELLKYNLCKTIEDRRKYLN